MAWDPRTTREIVKSLETLVVRLIRLQKYETDLTEMQMATLDETLEKVTEANTKADSLIAYNAGIKKQLDEVLSGVNLPAGVQAKVDAIFNEASASVDEIDEALNANVPQTPSGA